MQNVICECYQENSLNVWKLFSCVSVNLFLMRQLNLNIPRLFHKLLNDANGQEKSVEFRIQFKVVTTFNF